MEKSQLNPSGLNSQSPQRTLSFEQYIEQARKTIKKARLDLKSAQADTIIEANVPFILKPQSPDAFNPQTQRYKKGILLTHGLFASPLQVGDIGKYLQTQGYLVYGILLPGHGTVPGDLLDTSHQAWIETVEYGIQALRKAADTIHLAGFSLGAALSFYCSLTHPDIKSLVLLAPPLKIHPHLSFLIKAHRLIQPLRIAPRWYCIRKPASYALYTSYPSRAAHETQAIINQLNTALKSAKQLPPLFIIASTDDETVCYQAMLSFFKDQAHPLNRLLLYSNQPHAGSDPRMIFRPSAYPHKKILDFSHTCLPIEPCNVHLGENGDFKDFLHYKGNCPPQSKKAIMLGAATYKNLKNYIIQRLNYNPDFNAMAQEIVIFLKNSETF